MLVQLLGIICITATAGTLLYSQIHPSIIQIQGGGSAHAERYAFDEPLSLKFNEEQQFRCYKEDSVESPETRLPSGSKLKALNGTCWDSVTEKASPSVLRVCTGTAIYSSGGGNMQKIIATSNSAAYADIQAGSMVETFINHKGPISVFYRCNRLASGITQIDMSDDGHFKSITVQSFVFCKDPKSVELLHLIAPIPSLSIFVDEPGQPAFWEYQFQYPSEATQKHTDITGKTRNESYVLGRVAGNSGDSSIIRFSDLDIDAGDPYLSSCLKYPITDGDVCDRYNISRAVDVSYVCPLEWEEIDFEKDKEWKPYTVNGIAKKIFFARVRQVDEPRLCQYEFVVDATSLCLFDQFRPKYKSMENPRIIRCYPN